MEIKDESTRQSNQGSEIKNMTQPDVLSANLDVSGLKISLKSTQDLSEPNIIGGGTTLIAFKNLTSFASATNSKGLKVVENSTLIYSNTLPRTLHLSDIAYIDHLNCYLLVYNYNLYRKDIDVNQPYFLMKTVFSGLKRGTYLRYSKVNKRLIVAKDKTRLVVLNIEKRRIGFMIENKYSMIRKFSKIHDFRLFGSQERKMVTLGLKGSIHLYFISFDLRKIDTKNSLKIHLIEDLNECASSRSL